MKRRRSQSVLLKIPRSGTNDDYVHASHSSSSSSLTSSPASIASCLLFAASSLLRSSSFFNLLAELNNPFVADPQAAQLGSFLYLCRAHCSQK